MSSRRGEGKSFPASVGGNDGPSSKGKLVQGSGSGQGSTQVDQLSHDMADVSLQHSQQGEWEIIGKKSRNKGGSSGGKQWGSSAPAPKARGHTDELPKQGWGSGNGGSVRTSGNNPNPVNDPRRPAARVNHKPQQSNRNWESAYTAPPPAIRPPLQNGWEWGKKKGYSENVSDSIPNEESTDRYESGDGTEERRQPDEGSDDDDVVDNSEDGDDDDDDDDLSDDYDSDVSQKSHDTRKKNKWFEGFFNSLDKLSVEEINEQTRQWHCPACQNGPGAIDWYKGLQPLMAHAKTKGSTRVKLHRELAELLDEELRRRGTMVIPAGEAFGKWKGLRETITDHEIVWPPTVVVMNTQLDKDDNDRWIGMGNQELLEYFSTYAAKKARHSYGPIGHRGMSVLLFEADAMGYLEAERLHKHFAGEGRDRDAWERRRVLFYPGGKRVLYGYLARKEDMDSFNHHCQGKTRLKFDMRSYQEMVVGPMKQMSEDNQQLIWLKNKVVKQQQRSKAVEESFGVVSQKLRETMVENRIVRLRTKIQHEENKEEMDFQERFFKEQMDKVHRATEEKEKNYERRLQEEQAKAERFGSSTGTKEDHRLRKKETARFMDTLLKGVEEFETEREKLIKAHEEKKVELKRRYMAEEVKLEEEFDATLTELMNKFAPGTFEASTSSS